MASAATSTRGSENTKWLANQHCLRTNYFGDSGRETIRMMLDALKKTFGGRVALAYLNTTKEFHVLGSSESDRAKIKDILTPFEYKGWKPLVSDNLNKYGHVIVLLKDVEEETIIRTMRKLQSPDCVLGVLKELY